MNASPANQMTGCATGSTQSSTLKPRSRSNQRGKTTASMRQTVTATVEKSNGLPIFGPRSAKPTPHTAKKAEYAMPPSRKGKCGTSGMNGVATTNNADMTANAMMHPRTGRCGIAQPLLVLVVIHLSIELSHAGASPRWLK